MSTTKKLLAELNSAKGLSYPDIGYALYMDARGDGNYRPSVYIIINAGGGVTYSSLNATSARARCENIRRAIEKESNSV